MSLELVEKSLIKLLVDAFPEWENRIAWPNKVFKPQDGMPWMSYTFLNSEEHAATLGSSGRDEVNGLTQIDVNYPLHIGEGDLRKTINALRTCFFPRSISPYGQAVTILSRNRSGSFTKEHFFTTPFTIRWKAQINRT